MRRQSGEAELARSPHARSYSPYDPATRPFRRAEPAPRPVVTRPSEPEIPEPGAARRALWLRWILAGALGGLAVARVARRASVAAGESVWETLGGVAGEAVVGALALGGIMAGIAAGQWLVVRRRVPWAPWLAAGTVAGGVAGGGAGFGVLQGLTQAAGAGGAAAAAVIAGLAAFGAAKWLVLRGRVGGARRLAVVSAAGVVAAVAATALSAFVLGELAGGGAGGGVFGAAYAAVTGLAVLPYAGGGTGSRSEGRVSTRRVSRHM